MNKELLMISAYILLAFGQLQAQNFDKSLDSSSVGNKTIGDTIEVAEGEASQRQEASTEQKNDSTYDDNRTGASGGMGALSTTPGVSTTSGAGGLGTIENPGKNTSSDIYSIEGKDSIRKATVDRNTGESSTSERRERN